MEKEAKLHRQAAKDCTGAKNITRVDERAAKVERLTEAKIEALERGHEH